MKLNINLLEEKKIIETFKVKLIKLKIAPLKILEIKIFKIFGKYKNMIRVMCNKNK